jgi:release factor glutamine methyltransferase
VEVKEAVAWGADQLSCLDIEDAGFEAEYLLRHVLDLSRARLYAGWHDLLSDGAWEDYVRLIGRRSKGEPAAYLTGQKEFYGLRFLVDSRVLIPRPESELLVELALEYVGSRGPGPCTIADIGTGSGALAIALAVDLPQARVYAADISTGALEVASANCRRHGVEDRVTLLQGDLLEPLPCAVDVLVSNPPYVKASDWQTLPTHIRDHEPSAALNGGPDGLAVIRRLLPQAKGVLRPGGALFMEIGYDQGAEVMHLTRALFPDAEVALMPDLAGIDRVLAVYTLMESTPLVLPILEGSEQAR